MKINTMVTVFVIGSLLMAGVDVSIFAQETLPSKTQDEIQSILKAGEARYGIVGQSVAILKNGRLVYTGSHGLASYELNTQVTDQTVFQLFSISKLMAHVSLMQLVEADKLVLDAPISQYLSDLPKTWEPITVRQLLNHESGLPEFFGRSFPTPKTIAAALESVANKPMEFKTGSNNRYNQTNYILLKLIIEKITGQDYEAYVNQQMFQKLGMKSTRYGSEYAVVPGRATTYGASSKGLRKAGPLDQPDYFITCSGLNSNAPDMAVWFGALLNGKLISKQSLQTMWTPGLLNNGSQGRYANGWEYFANSRVTAFGHGGGNRLDARHFMIGGRENTFTIIYLSNGGEKDFQPRDMSSRLVNIMTSGKSFPDLSLSDTMYQEIVAGNWKAAQAHHQRFKKDYPEADSLEDMFNNLGYEIMALMGPGAALPVFKLNVAEYPTSANPYDSLGEVYLSLGDKDHAREFYSKSYELDPSEGVRKILDDLKK